MSKIYLVLVFGAVIVSASFMLLHQPESPQIEYYKITLDENTDILPEYKGTWLFKEGQEPQRIIP